MFSVEVRGLEPRSQDTNLKITTCLFYLFSFARSDSDRQDSEQAILLEIHPGPRKIKDRDYPALVALLTPQARREDAPAYTPTNATEAKTSSASATGE